MPEPLPPNVRLNARQRAMWPLRYVLGLTHAECGRRLGISRTGASNRDMGIREAFAAAGHREPRVPDRYAMRMAPMRSVAC